MKDCLKLIHFHIGSQITKIRRIKNALREASQFFVQLNKMGFNIEFVDTGGGMGVDYDGTRSSSSESSVNYSIQEYVNDVVSTSLMLPTNTASSQYHYRDGTQPDCPSLRAYLRSAGNGFLPEMDDDQPGEDAHELVKELYDIWDNLSQRSML